MRKFTIWLAFIALAVVSCGPRSSSKNEERTITVTIPPFAWFVEQIADDDFRVNVLLPPGADHHIWEPLPAQVSALSGSEAIIMNGQLGFEHAWMDRFLQVNPEMRVLDLSRNIELIGSDGTMSQHPSGIGIASSPNKLQPEGFKAGVEEDTTDEKDTSALKITGNPDPEADSHEMHSHDINNHSGDDTTETSGSDSAGDHVDDPGGDAHAHGGPDPHYWMSPVVAKIMARDIHAFLTELYPAASDKYDANLARLERKISEVDSQVRASLGDNAHRTVLIYHPALAYMGRDYGFEQVSFEDEGKNPSPARMKELIDLAREKQIKIIFIQAEYDVRNARSLSRETGAGLVVINPMNTDWPASVIEVARALNQPAGSSDK